MLKRIFWIAIGIAVGYALAQRSTSAAGSDPLARGKQLIGGAVEKARSSVQSKMGGNGSF